jgi:hypothetical protein
MLAWLRDVLRRANRDPTVGWSATSGLPLVLDLNTRSFCGVKLGQPIAGLAGLGPAEGWQHRNLTWSAYGVSIGITPKGHLARVVLVYQTRVSWARQRFCPYAGTCLRGGRAVALDGRTTEARLLEYFGEPYVRHDGDALSLFYEDELYEIIISLGPCIDSTNVLESLTMQTPPVLASERARAWYGVDRPCPPDSPAGRQGGPMGR